MRRAAILFALLVAAVLVAVLDVPAQANSISGTLYYTRFSGAPNVKSVTFSYDGVASFVLGAPVAIGTTTGADGIAGNPQNPDLLLVGGQGSRINTISKSTGTATIYPSIGTVYHLEVPNATTVYGSGIPGNLVEHTILPGGALSAPTAIALLGAETAITQLISTPTGFYYTSSGPGGFGNYGSLLFAGATATTTRLHGAGGSIGGSTLAAAHGGVYDPFTGNVIIMGSDTITQLDLAGNIVSSLVVAGSNFDQGTVDGTGHIFVANNNGNLFFMDYSATGLVGGANFTSTQFLDTNLDDIAPLVGSGTTNVPEPTTAVLGLLGFAALVAIRRRRRV